MQSKIIICFACLLGGCVTTNPVIQTVIQRVEIPISVPCKTETPVAPEFNFDKVTEEQDIFEKVRALLADRILHKAYETELSAALKSCK